MTLTNTKKDAHEVDFNAARIVKITGTHALAAADEKGDVVSWVKIAKPSEDTKLPNWKGSEIHHRDGDWVLTNEGWQKVEVPQDVKTPIEKVLNYGGHEVLRAGAFVFMKSARGNGWVVDASMIKG